MQVHWPLVISTACQRAGLGMVVCVLAANSLLGAHIPVNIACLAALALLCVGGAASVFHLQRPGRFFNAFSNPKSHLTQEGLITPFLGVALLVAGLDGVAFDLGGASVAAQLVAATLAVAFLVCTGLAYQMKSRPAWSTWYVFALFLLTAAEAGFAGALVLSLCAGGGAAGSIAACALAFGIATKVVQVAYIGRMKGVGYRVAYDATKAPYRPFTAVWAACSAVALACCAICMAAPAAALAVVAWVACAASVAAWTALFFKGAHKVKMFPMYAVDLNLDM